MPKYHVSRSVEIQADPMKVYDLVADYSTWTTWSPWLMAEPDAEVTVSKDPKSLGSTYAWSGEVTGAGQLEHKNLIKGELIEDDLQFLRPFKSHCKTAFHLSATSSGTKLTWTMDGALPWFLFWMIPMMKTFIGMDYQRGLAMIKELVETGAIASKVIAHGVTPMPALQMAGIKGSAPVAEIGAEQEKAFQQAQAAFDQLGLPRTLGVTSVYTKFDCKSGVFEFLSGFILPDGAEVPSHTQLQKFQLEAGNAFRVEHIGPYRHLGNGWSVANQLVRYKKLKQNKKGTYEIYRTQPGEGPEAEIRTDIYLPLKG